MLEKLLGLRSFSTTLGHLACRQVTLLASSRGLSLPLVARHVAPTSLRCWTLIIPALVSHSQQDDHLNLLDVVAHVKTDSYPFQVTLWDTRAMLPKAVQSHVLHFGSLVMQFVSSNAVLFDGPTTRIGIYFTYSKCSFRCCANTFSLLCKFIHKGLVINSS